MNIFHNTNYNNSIVVIPVYKRNLSKFERKSFVQCCSIFKNKRISIVTYKECDCSVYFNIAKQYNTVIKRENFDKYYFDDIEGYNQLMLSYQFYNRFRKYKYMLLYQLDAFVFRDELDYWCKMGYDYIGAPWFTEYSSYEIGADLWHVGNGGVSLRNISTMRRIFFDYLPLLSFSQVWNNMMNVPISARKVISFILRCFGYRNTITYFKKMYDVNEDIFISLCLEKIGVNILIPHFNVAMHFAFEKSPSYLYTQTNNKLPFVCHAWHKYEYNTFWKKYIKF
mgnify:CR=1 FL=1